MQEIKIELMMDEASIAQYLVDLHTAARGRLLDPPRWSGPGRIEKAVKKRAKQLYRAHMEEINKIAGLTPDSYYYVKWKNLHPSWKQKFMQEAQAERSAQEERNHE